MNSNKHTHKNVILPTLPDHTQSRKFQNIVATACLGLSLLCAISVVTVLV